MGIRSELIIDYEKKPAKELKKHNVNVAFEHFGIVRECHGIVNPCGRQAWVHTGMGTG